MPIRTIFILIYTIPLVTLAGCSSSHETNQSSTQTSSRQQIVAIINGFPITQARLQRDLGERVGKQAPKDFVLDNQLEALLKDRQIQVTQDDLDFEEQLILGTTHSSLPDASRYEMLVAIKQSRGLGPNRYPRFLRRNAMLRKLAGDTPPSQAQYLLAEQIAFGAQYSIRIFVSDSQFTTSSVRQQVLNAPTESRRWILADVCSTDSIHPSASRGGLINQLSRADPRYPLVLTDAIGLLEQNQISDVLATDSGFAFILLEQITPPE
ncbi:MAG: hypothetical protein JKX70_05375, partial [Phycisphaerales bacterium]|nr:hypothetical protein [Phycisphaerales bacterium]